MEKQYRVFVSSTYSDLQNARHEVSQALIRADCLPVGTELIPAADNSYFDAVKAMIDQSDFYILISAGRYGASSSETGLSYSELEYDYALESGKPIVRLLQKNPFDFEYSLEREQKPEKLDKLKEFRKKVSSKGPTFFWKNADELPRLALSALARVSGKKIEYRTFSVSQNLVLQTLSGDSLITTISSKITPDSNQLDDFFREAAKNLEASWEVDFQKLSDSLPQFLCSTELGLDAAAYRDFEIALDEKSAAIYFGSIIEITTKLISAPKDTIQAIARMRGKTFRVGIFRIGATIVVIHVAFGLGQESMKLTSTLAQEVKEVASEISERFVEKFLEEAEKSQEDQEAFDTHLGEEQSKPRTTISLTEKDVERLEELKRHFGESSPADALRRSLAQASSLGRYVNDEGNLTVVTSDGRRLTIEAGDVEVE